LSQVPITAEPGLDISVVGESTIFKDWVAS
jgi:hypothetical protein